MSCTKNIAVDLFDRFSLHLPAELEHLLDGLPEQRTLFITDFDATFLISFEEGMKCMDMCEDLSAIRSMLSFQYRDGCKYIHQKRTVPAYRDGVGSYAFFHIEMEDDDGNKTYLPGQMTAPCGYEWSEGVEPVLIGLLEGIAVCKTKGGG